MKKLLFCAAVVLSAVQAQAQEPGTQTQTQTTTTVTTTINQQQADSAARMQNQQPAQTAEPAPATQPAATPVARTQESGEDNDRHDYDWRRFYIGGRFLLTATDLDYNTNDNGTVTTKAVIGYGVGGFLGWNFSKNWAIQGEVLYQSLAQNVTFSGLDHKLNLKYVSIPLLVRWNSDVTKVVNFNICAGPQLGIRVNSSIDADNGSQADTLTATLAVKPGDIGLAFGAGLDFQLAEGFFLGIGYRGVYGLVDISEANQNNTTNNFYILDRSKVRTNSGYVGLTFAF